MDAFQRFIKWYAANCDGEWEHQFGIKIETLDNPGWSVQIDLAETSLENVIFEFEHETAVQDWYFVKISEKVFSGSCSPNNLEKIFELFIMEVLEKQSNPDYYYELFAPVNEEQTVYVSIDSEMITEDTFVIKKLPDARDCFWRFKTEEADKAFDKVECEKRLSVLPYSVSDKVNAYPSQFIGEIWDVPALEISEKI